MIAAEASSLQADLTTGLQAMHLSLGPVQVGQLMAYLALLQKWNRTYNLTAIREPSRMVSHHLLDSLSIVPQIGSGPVLDVGTGAGLPGIPLAIARPDVQVTMLDSNSKKTAFVQQVVTELGLANARVVNARVESWSPAEQFESIVSRAFSNIRDFAEKAAHLLRNGGELLAMKGLQPDDEMADLPAGFGVRQVLKLVIPGLDGQRHLVVIKRDARS
jgi:16S rRNA (guanine527-N7)-methyltransferase